MNSELLSHLGKMFGKIFRVQLSKKSPKSGIMCFTKIYPGPCKGAADGPCKGAAGPCKGGALPQGPGYILVKHIFPLMGDI